MFSGIIETMATAVAIEKDQENVNFSLSSPIAPQLKPAESLAHNGVCLTVVTVDGNTYTTTAMRETLQKTNLGDLRVGDKVNLERPLAVNARLDGHIVQDTSTKQPYAQTLKTPKAVTSTPSAIPSTAKWPVKAIFA